MNSTLLLTALNVVSVSSVVVDEIKRIIKSSEIIKYVLRSRHCPDMDDDV